MTLQKYKEQIYAGVLGKIIGVYMGRPVEGWAYEAIRSTFDEVAYYVSHRVGWPLIVPDDDISGTFVFYRGLADNGFLRDISARQIGDTWLNYVIENQTILWWGGLSRSTEHTAYLRLKAGIPAPRSGSIELNGRSMAEQIGAQIFIDTWALINPGDPDAAAAMARQAASVSHDGLAVEAACALAAMEAAAFEQRDLAQLLAVGRSYVRDGRLLRLIDDVTNECAAADDWRTVRDWIERHHGYHRYPGNCPMATNHAAVIMALLLGGDDFQRSVTIAASAGWDTDCNAGNVGCLNGIRLGLDGLSRGADLRGPVADQMYVVSADGGECVTDAVIETRKLVAAAAALRHETIDRPTARYAFEYPGSTQGFLLHPECTVEQAVTGVENALDSRGEPGLLIRYASLGRGVRGAVSAKTFVDPEPRGRKGTSYFEVLASPTLYSTQTVRAEVKAYADVNPILRFFVDYYGEASVQGSEHDGIATIVGEAFQLARGVNRIEWQVPDTQGHPIYRLGIELTAEQRLDGAITLLSLDWSGAPRNFVMGRSMELSPSLTPFTTETTWLKSFVSSAKNLTPDYVATFAVSHPESNGVVTTGTRDWRDYVVASTITFAQQKSAGLVARVRGHRRYYAAVLARNPANSPRGGIATIVKRRDGEIIELASARLDFEIDETHALAFAVNGAALALQVDGREVVTASDGEYESGGAGFVVDEGAIVCDGFAVRAIGFPG